MINSKFTLKKFLILIGEIYFYSYAIMILLSTILTPVKPIDYEQFIVCLLPFSHSAYWFITDYILLMILSPFLNRLIKSLTKEKFVGLLILVLVIWSIIPTFIGIKSFDINDLVWFVVLYIIGTFIRLHIDIPKLKIKKTVIGIICVINYSFCSFLHYKHLHKF